MGKVPTPNGGLVPPHFFFQKILKPDGVGTELVRSIHREASLGGRRRENERTVQSFIQSERAYIVRTKGVSYALNQSVKPPLP